MAKFYYIAKEKFKTLTSIKSKIHQQEWENAVDATDELYWYEDTLEGKEEQRLFPKDFHPKFRAVADKHPHKEYHRLRASLLKNYGMVNIDMDKPTFNRLMLLYDLASKLNAFLLVNGRKIIAIEDIEQYKRTKEK